ncbi:type II secretion system F family protein [bacterium]|nr:type II secretion system F family protein [bacterium]HPF36144.1 type II secretion system F family protein [Candidatus Krumholzibacteria bacterium]HRX51929.1 type II secretion system F family protein [Candidatus Krumholzibacteria bacterium]
MATYTYIAKTRTGEEVTGQTVGGSVDDVVTRLHGEGLAVLTVTAAAQRKSLGERWKEIATKDLGSASTADMALFSRQLSTVLESGIPLVKGLKGLAAESSRSVVSRAVPDVGSRLERGESLSEAMAAHPKAFDEMYLSMIRAGERAGALDKIVEDLAVYLEKVDEIRQKVKSAMSYPAFILIFVAAATIFLLVKIVPTFSTVYAELGQELPALTQSVLAVSDLIRTNALGAIAVVLALAVAFTLGIRTERGRYAWDYFQLKLPIFGPILMKSVMSRFARTFGILIGSGLPVLESLELCQGAAGNAVIAKALGQARNHIAAGHGVTESFRATKRFPEMILQLMNTGEEAGELDTMMTRAAGYYDRQVETTVDGISSLIEPVLIVIVGAVIGVIVISMFLPIFGMGDAMLQGTANM